MDTVDTRVPSQAAQAVTALYQAHSLGLVRLAVIMLGDQGAAEEQIADAMRISRGTVKSAVSRAVAAVGRMLREGS